MIRDAYKRPEKSICEEDFFVFCGNWIVGLRLFTFGCGFTALGTPW
jgi:hypothetical protein